MNYIVLAVSAKAKSGKTTFTDYIREYISNNKNIDIVYIPLAGKLKEIATDLYGWDGDKELYYREEQYSSGVSITEESVKEIFETRKVLIEDKGRRLLINIGDKGREIRPTVWVDYVVNKINKTKKVKPTMFLIDDLRYRNELEVLINSFGKKLYTVRINRKKSLKLDIPGEKDLDSNTNWSMIIENNGDKSTLETWAHFVGKTLEYRLINDKEG